jgi:ligand-binding sensor domain-containing protein
LKYNFNLERFQTFSYLKNTPLQIENISSDNKGNIWIASLTSGLLLFDSKSEKFTSYSFLLPSNKVQNVFYYNKENLFVSTEDKGFFKLNIVKKTFEKNQAVNIKYLSLKQGIELYVTDLIRNLK